MRLIILLMLLTLVCSTEVDNLNVLLPELKLATPILPLQLITAQGGCYHWTSSAPEILSVTANDSIAGSCSRQAVIQIAEVGPFYSSIFVTATDVNTQSILNIPVRIRRINKIVIVTKSRMMNIKEIQKLELFAYDSDENTFTSLQGLRFKWILDQYSQIIQSVPLSHAQLYLPLKTRQHMQKIGLQSDILVVQALAPGNLKIIVRCIEPGYQNLHDQITLSVHERFQLQPGPRIWIAPGSSLQLSLVRTTQQQISLPQSYYNIISCPGFSINSSLFLTGSTKPSVCTIKVEDTRTLPSYVSSVQIIVENPDQIRIIADSIMVVGIQQPYRVQLLRKNVILRGFTNKLKVSSDFTINTNLKTVLPQKKMVGLIKATFQNITKQIKINGLLPVQAVIPEGSLHLPVDEHFKLKVVGGTGYYEYFVSNQIASITSQGVIICKLPGNANIIISDRNHPSNKATIKLQISSIAFIQDLQLVKEVNRDQWGFFYIIAKNRESQTYTQCLQSAFQVSVPSSKLDIDKKINFVDQIKKLGNNATTLVKQTIAQTSLLKGRQQQIIDKYRIYVRFGELQTEQLKDYINNLQNYGICSIVKYKSQIGLEEKIKLSLVGNQQIKTQLSFRVYEPLINNIQEGNISFLLTPLSSLTWNFSGGSYYWPGNLTKVTLNGLKVSEGNFPIITCPNKQTLFINYDLRISNDQTRALLFPTYQHSTISVGCKFPKKMQLMLEYGMAFEQIFIYKNSNILGWVQPLDELNQRFYNASNIQYSFTALKGIIQGENNNFSYLSKEGSDLIKISCQRLKQGIFFPKIQISLSINVVDPMTIDHLLFDKSKFNASNVKKITTIVTLFTPKKPYILNLKNSSPLLNIQCTQSVACQRGENSVIVKLLSLGKGKVILKDKKIYGNLQWQFDFVIVEIDQIVVSGERNYMQEGESVNISISQYYQHNLISPLLYEIHSLQLILNRNLRVIEQETNRFLVRAQKEGNYSIHGEQTFPSVIRSKIPFNLYVYQKIEANIFGSVLKKEGNVLIIEGTIVIASGCRRTLVIAGGPSYQIISYQGESGVKVDVQSPTTYSITGIKQGTYFISFTSSFLDHTIAIINIKAIISNIEAIELISIDQPVINAQFRIIPIIKIGGLQIEECSCNFQFQWSVQNEFLRLGKSTSLGFLSARGINATALVAGGEVISLSVIDRNFKRIIGKASKYIQIISVIDFKMPTLIEAAYSSSSSLLLPPLSSYAFPKDYVLEAVNGIIKIGLQHNIVQSGKKIGQSSLQIIKPNYKTEILQVQVLPISGIFIQNQNGFVTMQPYSELSIPLYFQDRHGRLFITPLINFQPIITFSNQKILEGSLSNDGKHLHIRSLGEGICLLMVKLYGKNIEDAIAVSIGSQIKPSSSVRVLKNGIVKYSLANQQNTKWKTSNAQIAQIDIDTGILHAKQLGRCKIENGQLFGQIIISQIAKVQEVIVSKFDGKDLQVIYRFLWLGNNGLQELSHLKSNNQINNNFNPQCHSKNKELLETISEIVQSQGYQRLLCKINIVHSIQMAKMQNQFEIIISDQDGKYIQNFKYPFDPHFRFDTSKTYISLSTQKAKEQIQIQTLTAVMISQTNGLKSWVRSSFDENRKIQTIIIDMSGQKNDWNWQLLLESGQQKQIIKIDFSSSGQTSQNHSFWSLSLDWPDYLIILMGGIFAAVCLLQYMNEQKIKSQ